MNMCALVVEDDMFSRDMLVRQLQNRGIDVAEAADGEEASSMLSADHSYDVVLLDINLPHRTGLEVLEDVRRHRSRNELPIILVSALSQAEDVVKGLELGANDYVTKPINATTLMARVAAAVGLKRSFEELVQAEQQRVMIESMGAACHHLAQPLTVAIGVLSQHLDDLPAEQQDREGLEMVMDSLEKAAAIVHTMQDVRSYRTTPYLEDHKVLDLGLPMPGSSEE